MPLLLDKEMLYLTRRGLMRSLLNLMNKRTRTLLYKYEDTGCLGLRREALRQTLTITLSQSFSLVLSAPAGVLTGLCVV